MPSAVPPPRSVRPEWLFEVAGLVQRLVLPDRPAQRLLARLPAPRSRCERAIVRALALRASVESGRGDPGVLQGAPRSDAKPDEATLPPGVRRAVFEAARILRAECPRSLSLGTLAGRVRCNRTDLERGFLAAFRCPLPGFQTRQRVREARRLLRDGRLPASAVARRVGDRSLSAVYTVFA